MEEKHCVVAIDGPAGVGKSTVSRAVASRLGFCYVDTGAIYRAISLKAHRLGIPPDADEQLAALVNDTTVAFALPTDGEPPGAAAAAAGQRVLLDGTDVTEEIRDPEINRVVSVYSANRAVRRRLVALQRRMGQSGDVVMEGRDIGTAVFPDAELKFFLDAASEVRSRRRLDELLSKGVKTCFEETRRDLEARDKTDRSRAESPLARAADAEFIDTSELGVAEVVDRIVSRIRARRGDPVQS
ncbi:MAG: (d)CMP kinase [Candidatus Schekmanbacteria bacterium]|nr:(d)CMP kinase [Candidatus Schekmanbacteria bacterium]